MPIYINTLVRQLVILSRIKEDKVRFLYWGSGRVHQWHLFYCLNFDLVHVLNFYLKKFLKWPIT